MLAMFHEWYWAVLLIAFSAIGAGLKYIDQVYDAQVFDRRVAWVLGFGVGLLMGALITVDYGAALILVGIIVSVGIAGKIDTGPFYLATVLSFSIPAVAALGGWMDPVRLDWLLFPVVLASLGDEFLDQLGERWENDLLTLRPVLKILLIVYAALDVFSWVYAGAILVFDGAYIAVHRYSAWKR